MNYDCLIVDDEKLLCDSTAEYFNLFGIKTATAYSTGECLSFLEHNKTCLLLLDINLGDGSGFALCRKLRETTDIPILFISARSSDDDKIIALNIGGDDYIQKPYSLGVLFAKVKAVLKRYRKTSPSFSDGRLTVDIAKRQLILHGEIKKLKALEFKLLAYLVENRDRVVGKRELFEKVWGEKYLDNNNTVMAHIGRLREKLKEPARNPKFVKTVWGVGYKVE